MKYEFSSCYKLSPSLLYFTTKLSCSPISISNSKLELCDCIFQNYCCRKKILSGGGGMTKKIFSSGIIFLGYKSNFQKSYCTCPLGSYGTENKIGNIQKVGNFFHSFIKYYTFLVKYCQKPNAWAKFTSQNLMPEQKVTPIKNT